MNKAKIMIFTYSCRRDRGKCQDAVRDTWLASWGSLVDQRFVLGRGNEEPRADELVFDVDDSYDGLVHKQIASYRWALDHQYDYVFVSYIDTWVNVPALLKSGFEEHDYVGRKGAFEPYIGGGHGYWLSRKSLEVLARSVVYQDVPDRFGGVTLLKEACIVAADDKRYGTTLTRHLSVSTGDYDPAWMIEHHRTFRGSKKNNVLVVSAYVPLSLRNLSRVQFNEFGTRLVHAFGPGPGETRRDGFGYEQIRVFHDYPLAKCWLAKEDPPMVPAGPVASDRFASPEDYVRSNIVMHNKSEWALMAARENLATDVVVWFDYGILKQGNWKNNPVTEDLLKQFVRNVEKYDFFSSIPFPGIEAKKPTNVHGSNWRFCGSTLVWPVKWLKEINRLYKVKCREFIAEHGCVPDDLAIWPAVEEAWSSAPASIPFRWYQAEYDATQLTNFPESER